MDKVNLRLNGLSGTEWRDALDQSLSQFNLKSAVAVDPAVERQHMDSLAIVDPTVLVAAITGGAAIITALIPVLADILRAKTKNCGDAPVKITIRGTRNSVTIATKRSRRKMPPIDIGTIGAVTEISVSI